MVDGTDNISIYDESDDVVQQVHGAKRVDVESRLRDVRKSFSPMDVKHLERCKKEASGGGRASTQVRMLTQKIALHLVVTPVLYVARLVTVVTSRRRFTNVEARDFKIENCRKCRMKGSV